MQKMPDNGPWQKKVVIGNCTLLLGDCREVLPHLPKVDLVLTDPPYGIKETGNNSRQKDGISRLGTKTRLVNYEKMDWDNKPPEKELIDKLISSSKHSIIFGGNYFNVSPSKCWFVWDKLNSGDFADAELAWSNINSAVRVFRHRWNGMIRDSEHSTPREHPTQKPIALMEWCINLAPKNTLTVADPFMGSGTTGVACANMGKTFYGVEREPKYFDIACKRIEAAYAQGRLFA